MVSLLVGAALSHEGGVACLSLAVSSLLSLPSLYTCRRSSGGMVEDKGPTRGARALATVSQLTLPGCKLGEALPLL